MNKRNIEAIYPLTPAQQGMLYGTLSGSNVNLYVEQICCTVNGKVEHEVLERVWATLTARHPILRTGFVYRASEKPLQFVLRDVKNDVVSVNFTDQSGMRIFCGDQVNAGFDLEKAPLIRVALASVGKSDYRLILTMHHILMDGWCSMLLLQELFELYNSINDGVDWKPAPPLPFKDYVQWINSRSEAKAKTFWKQNLQAVTAGTPPGKVQTIDSDCSKAVTYDYRKHLIGSERKLTLDSLLRDNGLTWNTAMQSAFALMLATFHRSSDLVFGTTVTERPDNLIGIENTLGLFINTVPFALKLPETDSLLMWLQSVQQQHVKLRDYAHCSAGNIHQWCGFSADTTLFDSIIVFENYPLSSAEQQTTGLKLVNFEGDGGRTAATLTLLIAAGEKDLQIKAVYHEPELDGPNVDLLFAGFDRALDAMIRGLQNGGRDSLSKIRTALTGMQVPQIKKITVLKSSTNYLPPNTDTEIRLHQIWCKVLGLESLSVKQNFFELGGHSLLATQLLETTRQTFGVKLNLVELFSNATVQALAALLDQQLASKNEDGQDAAAQMMALPELVIDARNRYQPFQLTDIQQAYWIGRSNIFQMGNVATHVYMEIEVEDVDEDRFHMALKALILRHDMLRMIVDEDGRGRILEKVPDYQVAIDDLRALGEGDRFHRIGSIRDQMSHKVLPSDHWPLFDMQASRIDDRRYRLHLSLDMLIVDGSSHHILFRDFLMFYYGESHRLEPLQLNFRDYACLLQTISKSEPYEQARQYWLSRIESLPLAPRLPLAVDPQSLKLPKFVRRKTAVSPKNWKILRKLCRSKGITESALFCAIYAEVLRFWSRSNDFCINLTLFNRLPVHKQINEIVGDFTSTLLLAAYDSGGSFYDRCREMQTQLWTDMDHSLFSGVEVLRELNRRANETVAMPVVFTSGLVFEDSMEEDAPSMLGADDDESFSIGQTSQVWLDLQVLSSDGGLLIYMDAVEALFPEGVVDAMFSAFKIILHNLCVDPSAFETERFELLPANQLAMRQSVNSTATKFQLRPLHESILNRRNSDIAVVDSLGSLSFQNLHRVVATFATDLKHIYAIRPNEPVAVYAAKGRAQVISVLAISAAGGSYVPFDSGAPQARINGLLEQTAARIVLCDQERAELLIGRSDLQVIVVDDSKLETLSSAKSNLSLQTGVDLDDMAYIIFTSGSTGAPKGVVINHRGAANTIKDINSRFKVSATDRTLGLSALNFDLSVYDIFGLLAVGGAIVMPSQQYQRDPEHWYTLVIEQSITIFNAVPALVQMFVDYLEVNNLSWPQSLRLVMMSGDWVPVSIAARIRALSSRKIEPDIVSLGGATEASIWSIIYPISRVDNSWKSIPYGKPLANQSYHVLKPDFSNCPDFLTGDLYIGGVGLAREYWQDTERTQQAFVRHPSTNERLYRTGDIGRYLPDGNIEFMGREDTQVKVRGHRIELGEIETHLLRHPALSEAVVAADGEHDQRRLLAWFVVQSSHCPAPDQTELDAFLRSSLPYYMIPDVFTAMPSLPLTANGKVDRKHLPKAEITKLGETAWGAISGQYAKRTAEFWSSLLGKAPTSLGDNFLEKGGNSVSLVQLSTRLRAEYSIDLPLKPLFEQPTLKCIAELVEKTVSEQGQNRARVDDFISIVRRQRALYWLESLNDNEVEAILAKVSKNTPTITESVL